MATVKNFVFKYSRWTRVILARMELDIVFATFLSERDFEVKGGKEDRSARSLSEGDFEGKEKKKIFMGGRGWKKEGGKWREQIWIFAKCLTGGTSPSVRRFGNLEVFSVCKL